MKIYDIAQEVFSCTVYPGDPTPQIREETRMARGDAYNLTSFSMCAHNGTHIDAPFHFLKEGTAVEQIPLYKTVGYAYVACHEGELTAEAAREILQKAKSAHCQAAKRILLKGDAIVNLQAAEVFAKGEIDLIGVESQSVGPMDAPAPVHRVLLEKEIVLLEGIRLGAVAEGVYFLNAAPLNLGGADGAPCRAILIEF